MVIIVKSALKLLQYITTRPKLIAYACGGLKMRRILFDENWQVIVWLSYFVYASLC